MLWPPHQGVSGHKAETIQMDSDAITLAYSSLTSPRPGRGLAVCPLQKYVWRPAGPRHSHLPGFIIWKFWPYRPRSFLHNMLTLVIWQASMGVCLLVRSWPSIELRGCTDLFGTITQGRVNIYEFDPITFCRTSLYNTWSLWAHLGA